MGVKTDKFNRSDYINFIKNLIIHSDKYKRNNDSLSYVIALDSAWGTGKSHFIDLLIQDINDDDDIKIIKYNAWKNDYCENAFNPLIYDILNSDILELKNATDADIENGKKLLKNIGKIGFALGKNIIKEKYDIDLSDLKEELQKTGSTLKDFMLRKLPNLSELNSQRQSFEEFKESLGSAINWLYEDGKKVVVIIDELDRCKPTFAVQTLEIVKHIFDVENIIFLFAVDIQQLSHSISNVYGQGFDSVGYLCRFFDYIAKLPVPNIRNYIEEEIKKIDDIPQIVVPSLVDKYQKCFLSEIVIDFFVELYTMFDFTLRDLDTVLQSYKIMLNNFLGEYKMVGAHMIYLFYLSLKYKQPQKFNSIFIDSSQYKTYLENEFKVFAEKVTKYNKWIMDTIIVMKSGTLLSETDLKPSCNNYGESGDGYGWFVGNVKNDCMFYRHKHSGKRYDCFLKENGSVGNVLFYPDLMKWDEIKSMTYREYLHKQLEMYNFIDSDVENNV